MVLVKIAVVLVVVIFVEAAKLPSYFPPCVETDPDYDTCAKASVKAALPNIYNGDPSFHIPRLDPLEIDEVKLNANQLTVSLTKLKLVGLSAIKELDEFHWDKKTNTVTGQVSVPNVHITATYNIDGRILVLPIKGEGPFEMNMENLVIKGSFPFEFIPQADGSRKIKVNKGTITYTKKKSQFHFENLFGDKTLSDNMNKLINENSEAVIKDLGDTIPVTLEAVIRSIAEGVFSKITV